MYERLLRDLSVFAAGDLPVLTAYLDVRPQATGQTPELRSGMVVLKDRLNEIEKTFRPRGPALDSFRADRARIERFLEHDFSVDTHGLAIFASSGRGLFETVEVRTPFDSVVVVGPAPDLFQLAKLLDDHETVVVAVVDSNTVRIFVTEYGRLDEVGGPDDKDTKYYRKRRMGGLSQMRYQRIIDLHRARFAGEMAEAIDHIVRREQASRLILAGDEVTIPTLLSSLSRDTRDIVHDDILRIDIRAPRDDVHDEVAPILAELAADASLSTAERLIAAVRSNGLGVVGIEATRRALEAGTAETLVLDETARIDREERAALVQSAGAAGVGTEVVTGIEALLEFGGVGALLRYRAEAW